MSGIELPPSLEWLEATADGRAWLAAVPARVDAACARWGVRLDGPAYPGSHVSLAAPVVGAGRERAVLKVQFPHPECEHEAAALARWQGAGAVRLLAHAPDHHALLLERCDPGTHLAEAGADTALDVLAALVPRLAVPAGPPFRALADEAAGWAERLPRRWERAGRPFARVLVDTAVAALRELGPTQGDPVLLHQDLHADNVLAASREPWLVIDPKPLAGELAFAVAPVVRSHELGHGRADVRRRLDHLTVAWGVDRERARGWALGQTVAWAVRDDGAGAHPRHVETATWLLDA